MLPTVDISVYKAGGDLGRDDVQQAVRQLHQAIIQHGFCYLTGHGVPQHMVDKAFEVSRQFFHLPDDVKQRYAISPVTFHGYVAMGSEKVNAARAYADVKEAFNYSPRDDNPMPREELPEMEGIFGEMYSTCKDMALRLLDLLALALDITDLDFLRKCHQKAGTDKNSATLLRSCYYPTKADAMKEGRIWCSEHSDYISFTLLFQDDVGGLQIEGKDGQYHDVPPVPGTLVLNVGDLMQRWTADNYPSTKHRVVMTEKAFREGRPRQSLAFFCCPDDDAVIACLDGSNKYPPITAYQYVRQLMDASR